MSDAFPSAVEQFIHQHIQSLAQLEALLLLRQDPERAWTAAEVAKALYTAADTFAAQLIDLEKRGFLTSSPPPEVRFRYQPASPDADRLIGDLAALYQERRVAVITLIYSKPVSKVQTFADAFRLRREE